ncbi:windei [Carabus blaptoides fortunei]
MLDLLELLETGHIRSNLEYPADDSLYAENSQSADANEIDIQVYLENKLSEANIADELVRKVNERMQDVTSSKQNCKDRAIQLDHIGKVFANGSTSPNDSTSTGDEQVAIPEDKPVAYADILSAREDISKLALELSLPNESQQSIVQQILNTALLPRLPIIHVPEALLKPVVPAPQIKIHLQNDQVTVTWSMLEEDLSTYEPVLSYQVYCCKETNTPPTPATWWKLIELSADPLPMTYVLDRLTAGKYYVAVRGIDVQFRAGPFSSPVTVIFGLFGAQFVAQN